MPIHHKRSFILRPALQLGFWAKSSFSSSFKLTLDLITLWGLPLPGHRAKEGDWREKERKKVSIDGCWRWCQFTSQLRSEFLLLKWVVASDFLSLSLSLSAHHLPGFSYKEWKAVYFNLLNAPHTRFAHMMQLMTLTVSAFPWWSPHHSRNQSLMSIIATLPLLPLPLLRQAQYLAHRICGVTRFTSLPPKCPQSGFVFELHHLCIRLPVLKWCSLFHFITLSLFVCQQLNCSSKERVGVVKTHREKDSTLSKTETWVKHGIWWMCTFVSQVFLDTSKCSHSSSSTLQVSLPLSP